MNIPSELARVPTRPGVYIFKGQKERVIYIGKAKNLRNRMRSYFHEPARLDLRKTSMLKSVKDFSYIVTDNELEALILEANLIKQYKPRFNIILRDDKNYPYIKLTTTEQWPRIEVVRRILKDGNAYFGPYVPAQSMWETLTFIRRNFLIRTCRYSLDKPMRPCIQYQMKRCSAPCAGFINRQEYMKIVDDVILFLKGEKKELIEGLEHKMQRLSDETRYEEAAKIRDRIFKLQRAFESQKVIAPELGDIDVIGCYLEGQENTVSINVLFVRNGVLIGSKDFLIDNTLAAVKPEIMHSFIELFYAKEIIPPSVILTNIMPDDLESLTEWLKSKKGDSIAIEVPQEGKRLELLRMSNENARLHFNFKRKLPAEETIKALKDKLNLINAPSSIGAFDVSTIQGSESVGAFVFWEKGEFKKDKYRHLRIKGVQGVDDYSMMKEIVQRILLKTEDITQKAEHRVYIPLPDLIIIDGGKGQLEAARRVMEELGIETEVVSIAKKPDRAFLLNGKVIDLEDGNKAALLLKRIRDEVHRAAISFHRKLRDKRLKESLLEKIPGIGKKRRLELLRHFGSIENIRKAEAVEVMKIKGFPRKVAERLIKEIKA